jgi:hypothetical protein
MSTGAELIAAERRRQIEEEGWTPAHDDQHDDSELLYAAEAYMFGDPDAWPWEEDGFKPKDIIHDLARAGAFIAAELDRQLRLRPPRPEDTPSPGCCPNCGSAWERGIEMGVAGYIWFPTCGCSVVAGPGTIRFDPVPCDDPGLLLRTAIGKAAAAGDAVFAELQAEIARALRVARP